jgi:hypothetical protein
LRLTKVRELRAALSQVQAASGRAQADYVAAVLVAGPAGAWLSRTGAPRPAHANPT